MNQIAKGINNTSPMSAINLDFSEDMILEGIIVINDPLISVEEVASLCESISHKGSFDCLHDPSYQTLRGYLGDAKITITYDIIPENVIPPTTQVESKIVLPYYIVKRGN